MQIDFKNPSLNFKQIRLNEAEMKIVQSKYQQMLNELENSKQKSKIFDIFESHLNKEVVLKRQDPSKGRKIFAVTLFAKFFQYLEETKKRFEPFEAFIKKINCY